MAISVLNTDSDLSAKTLVTAEGDRTISGNFTFSRSPSAPFTVQVGSATVTNLDAGFFNGQLAAFYRNATNINAGVLANTFLSVTIKPTVVTLVDGATPALDASLGTVFVLVAAGNRTIAVPSNAVDGQKMVIRHQASGGARTLALNSGAGGFRFGTDITALTSTTSGKWDYIGCIYNGTDSKWDVVGYTKGF